jgi:hypothetical protein
MAIVAKVLLGVALMCLVLAGWSLIQGEVGEALLGFGFGILLLLYWRWAKRRQGE